jgi:hypothetical protein
MKKHADIAVYDPDYNLQLVVEIKNLPAADNQWAIQMRGNLLFKYEMTPNAPYFLLALPDHFYLWTNSKGVGEDAPPDYVINATAALTYFKPLPRPLTRLGRDGLEMLMNEWLRTVVATELQRTEVGQPLAWLFDSGLYNTIKQGEVRVDS